MVRINIGYQGDLHCQLEHESSKTIIHTDAPVDNKGRGASFSPTDLVAAGLGSCIVTTMAIAAQNNNRDIPLEGTKVSVEKYMSAAPRRIERLAVDIEFPFSFSESDMKFLENVARTCPVHRNLEHSVQIDLTIRCAEIVAA